MARYIIILLLTLSICSCKKEPPKPVCTETAATNYGKKQDCHFPIDDIKGSYWVAVTRYDLQPDVTEDSFILEVRDSYCMYLPDQNSGAEIVTLNSLFSPSYFCIQLVGYQSYFDGIATLFASAYLTGQADFTGGVFSFDGFIHNSDSSYVIQMKSVSFHHKDSL